MTTETENKKRSHAELMELMGKTLSEYIEAPVSEEAVRRIIDEKLAELPVQKLEVTLPDGVTTEVESPHKQLTDVIELVKQGHNNILLVGPAGTGKTTIASDLAKALNLEFGFLSLSAGVTEAHLFGRILPQADGAWAYQSTRFVDVYENGGVFLLDEVDAADPNLMVSINAAIANGHLSNVVNGKIHQRHPNCILIAAANTYGLGADAQYVGRNPLDASTLDRFVLSTTFVDYDTDLEKRLAQGVEGAESLLDWVWAIRSKISEYRLRRIASTRVVVNGLLALRAERSLNYIKTMFLQSWSKDEVAKVESL
ncbi:MAG: AAA family ATPase [Sedimentisphaerales bacterium]|nr:AAA family ATPase [Sedimentisphaerales bacterium]